MPATTYTANLIAKATKNGTAYQGPATVYLALVITTPTKATPGTEQSGGAYARYEFDQTTDWTDDNEGNLSNTANVEYPLVTLDYDDDIVAVEAYDDPTAGERLWFIVLSAPRAFVVGQTPKFLAGDLVLEVV